MVDITPAMGIQIAGDIGRLRPVEEVREPLYAHALALQMGDCTCCLLSIDLCIIMPPYIAEIRREAQARFGLDPSMLLIHPVQNHAAPSLGHNFVSDDYLMPGPSFLRGGDDRYHPVAVEGIVTAIGQALAKLEPVEMQVGRGVDGRVAFNRRFIMRDGTALTHPPMCDPNILQSEGPIDPEVSVITLTNAAGRVVSVLLHHTCHPVHGYPQRWISGGWPGAWARRVQAIYGEDCVPLVINGACGNIHHCNHLDPNYRDDYEEMGRKLAETTRTILSRLQPVASPTLACTSRMLRIPLRELDPEVVAADERWITEHPEPMWKDDNHEAVEWDWVYAHAMMDLKANRARQPYFDYEIQVFQLGNTAIVAWVGEPFVEAQLQLKLHSPAAFTMVAHMSNGYVGYIPTREALRRGGFETRTANWSKLVPEALESITEASLELLQELFPK